MKKYILLFNNGHIVQQDGINGTYMVMVEIGVLKMIIDTKAGKIVRGEDWAWEEITSFDSSDLIKNFE